MRALYLWRSVRKMARGLPGRIALGILSVVVTTMLGCWLLRPAVPRSITISTGQPGSSLYWMGRQYAKVLARYGITLNVVPSDGSRQNLERLLDPGQQVDVALVQSGVARDQQAAELMSLGSVTYVPLLVFYRGNVLTSLSQLSGKRIAIGREGSGTRELSLKLLAANGVTPGADTMLLSTDGLEAATQLVDGEADAVILSGDSATRALMLRLYRVPGISLMDFADAPAYTRRFSYLDEIDLPPGILDLGRRIPPQTVHLIAPTVELVARKGLHPALSDLLIEAAQEVHGKSTIMQRAGQFPNPIARDFPISEEATRYYRSGKSYLYRTLPFWLASATDRALLLLVPLMVLIVPALRLIPALYRWRVRSRIYRFYGRLLAVERKALALAAGDDRRPLLAELASVEQSLDSIRLPLAYADALYILREHIVLVRARLGVRRKRPLHG
ncbi:C4-dicarboxylate ABC transporter substrate-binding protein [Caballeronia grimmiae]|uniref:C4-dicarboxylate ABC transporter substrate-binding protein n=2 Tax=Caballeronia grimmiae TaxID=1071679 RepID=A0A069NV45_9BURK|nr:C4-dicarboxylate ABC transporter substrate-binding protein [Caballeronia grimmiae]